MTVLQTITVRQVSRVHEASPRNSCNLTLMAIPRLLMLLHLNVAWVQRNNLVQTATVLDQVTTSDPTFTTASDAAAVPDETVAATAGLQSP